MIRQLEQLDRHDENLRAAGLDPTEHRQLDIGGPGRFTTGGGFVGGGAGLIGGAEGIAMASLLSKLRTTTHTLSVIRFGTPECEGFFAERSAAPDELRRTLSGVFVELRRIAVAPGAPTDVASQLERIARLYEAGILSGEEFQAAKRAVLQSE
jgi:hypothetical protein